LFFWCTFWSYSALVNNCEWFRIMLFGKFSKWWRRCKLISPDGGALKKKSIKFLNFRWNWSGRMQQSKRCKTGRLSGFKVYRDVKRNGLPNCYYLRRWRNFVESLAEKIKKKEKTAGKLYLAVSHGIFNIRVWGFRWVF